MRKEIDYNSFNENSIIENMLNNNEKSVNNGLFAYYAMRLSGLGLAERNNNDKVALYDRDKCAFTQNDFMKLYANLPVCVAHPEINGEKVLLGYDNAEQIIGNTIYSYLKDNEIWVIARIHNKDAINAMESNDFSTSPHFVSTQIQKTLENGDVIYVESPVLINHLAIVASGFWDKKSSNKPISKELKMPDNETQQADEIVSEESSDNTTAEVKADEAAEDMKADSEVETTEDTKATEDAEQVVKADDNVISLLAEQVKALAEKVAALESQTNDELSDSEELEKDEVIQAINDIADSNDYVEKIRIRDKQRANVILQNFLKANKKNVSKKYHSFIDNIPANALNIAKEDVLNDLKANLNKLKDTQTSNIRGWSKDCQGNVTFRF